MSRIFPVLFKNYPIVFQRNFILYYNDLLLEIVHFSHTAIKYYVNQFIFMYLTKKGQYWTQSTANYRTTFIQDIKNYPNDCINFTQYESTKKICIWMCQWVFILITDFKCCSWGCGCRAMCAPPGVTEWPSKSVSTYLLKSNVREKYFFIRFDIVGGEQ